MKTLRRRPLTIREILTWANAYRELTRANGLRSRLATFRRRRGDFAQAWTRPPPRAAAYRGAVPWPNCWARSVGHAISRAFCP